MTEMPPRPSEMRLTATASPRILTTGMPEVSGTLPVYMTAIGARPEVRYRDPLAAHLADASAVARYVAPLPARWQAVKDRWEEMISSAFPSRERLAEAVISGAGDLAQLHALALAEISANTETEAELRRHVGARVFGALAEAYQPVAAKSYQDVAALFDAAAQQRDDARLDELLPVMRAAARLVGATPDVGDYATHFLGLALTVDPAGAHRRRLVEKFPHWAAIRELGAQIRANTDPRAQAWRLPELIRCFDTERRLRDHDPLDGPPPKGWRPALDGWETDNSSAAWSR